MRRTTAIAFAIALGLGWAGQASAQAEHYGNRPYELNVHVGALMWDDDVDLDTALLLGARIFLNMPSGWAFGGNFDWTQSTLAEIGEEDIDLTTFLYSGEVEYTFGSPSRIHPFVGAGIGAATFKPEGDGGDETELLIPLAGGIKWFPRTTNSNWAIRGEIRDNIIRFSEDDFDETTHNFEISGGISFLFGGG